MTLATSELDITPHRDLYPPIEPYNTQMVDVGDGQQLYVEQCGNPEGKPVVFLHGGPGGGGGTERRRFFNPDAYRIIILDQRGCGLSTPHIAQAHTPREMATNTTWKLVEDLEKIRELLGIERWEVFGGSWGSCLSLAYAETHPERVTELVLRGIFTMREQELDWYYNFGASEVFPELWNKFCEPLRRVGHDFSRDNIAAYYDLLWDDDPDSTVLPRWPGRHGRARRPRCPSTRPTSRSSRIQTSRWPSPASRTTTLSIMGSWLRGSCCVMPTSWPTSRLLSFRDATTCAAPTSRPSICREPCRVPICES